MDQFRHLFEPDIWVIWNSGLGLRARASLGEIEQSDSGHVAWLEEPYDMVGPFDLEQLINDGIISFAACVVMSQEYWAEHKERLLLESQHDQRETQRKMNDFFARFSQRGSQRTSFTQKQASTVHRQALGLPLEGSLNKRQVTTAYRRLAQKHHPDAGGSQTAFVKITQARDELLARL